MSKPGLTLVPYAIITVPIPEAVECNVTYHFALQLTVSL